MKEEQDAVKKLIREAAKSEDPRDAMAFSQAACNAANALRCLQDSINLTK